MEKREWNTHKSRSLIEEIRAQDIYTLHYPDKGPTLPSVTSFFGSFGCETLINRETILRKSSQRCRAVMKKLSVQQMKRSLVNLPALIEEDYSYQPSVPMYSQDATGVYGMDVERLCVHDATTCSESRCFSEVLKIKHERLADEEDEITSDKSDSSENDDSSLEVLDDDESWVDLSKHTQPSPPQSSLSQAFSSARAGMPHTPVSPDRVTPLPFGNNGEEYLRLLREAQKESNQSSARVSLASSRRDTPRDSPKSPPNSPNTEMIVDTEETPIKGVYINYYNREGDFVRVEKNVETDWIWDWSSRPDQAPPKEWKFVHPGKKASRGASIRRLMVGNSSLFSRDVLYTLLITNVLSLLLGTGIGIWLSKRSGGNTLTLSAIPLN